MDKHPTSPGHLIRKHRLEQKLSRQSLAQAADLDIEVVRRIEHGAYARCEEAMAIARALDVSADGLFGGVFARLAQFPSNAALTETAWNNRAFRQEIAEYGVDIHPALWFLKLRFPGGAEGTYPISVPDLDRFQDALESEEEQTRFVLFASSDQIIAVNVNAVVHAHALFEGAGSVVAAEEGAQSLRFLLAGEKEPMTFGSDPDISDDIDDAGAYHGQLHALVEHLKAARSEKPFVTFFDEDGEQVAFRLRALALAAIPHVLLWGYYDENIHDGPEPSSPPRRPQLTILDGGR